MAVSLPYLASPGSITTALTKIRNAATPERVTTDFVTTKLMMKGGTGAAIPSFLKKINFSVIECFFKFLKRGYRSAHLIKEKY